jgi:hypothetical protein
MRFSGTGRILSLLITVPCLFLLDRPLDIGLSAVLAVGLWLLAARRAPLPLRLMRSFLWLAPALVLANGLAGPAPRILRVLSRPGLIIGLVVTWRFIWAAWLAIVLIRACPPLELLASFRAILKSLRIPDRELSVTLFLTMEMLPRFADIRVRDFRNLPDAIATRLKETVVPDLASYTFPYPGTGRLVPADLLLVLPCAAMVTAAAVI